MGEEGHPVADGGLSTLVPISAVAARTGVTVTTLRMWQSRYGLGPSVRSAGGHRRYTEGDVHRLLEVKRLLERGIPTAEAVRSVLPPPGPQLRLPAEADPLAHEVGRSALDLDGPTVRRLLARALADRTVLSVWEGVLRPVLATIGAGWPTVSHGIAVEHLLSHIAAGELAAVTAPPAEGTPEVLLASAPAELHDLPLVALNALLGGAGIVLGARTPVAALVTAAAGAPPAAIVVLALTPEVAEPEILAATAAVTRVIAAGPGWDPATLPADVLHSDGLAPTAAAVVGTFGG